MDWTPYLAGLGIGILSWFTFLLSARPLGCSTAYARTSGMIERAIRGDSVLEKPYYRKFVPQIDWEWMLVLGIVIGAFITAIVRGEFALIWVPSTFEGAFGSSSLLRLAVALVGGVLMGLGARWAGGCTSGHGISGTLQLAIASWIAVVTFFVSGIIVAFLLYGVIAPW
ncbi:MULTISPECIES: YeeE/YedE thiosulfate transporter family protein [unclassified Methanoculleus]|uniref:YeeE/YedE thiosulfate transporter family protein n=1 Tax=unclassified Methanoculleus TaxID=2619537 RepID=UPI0025E31380|nr:MULTISPECIES: YeeE/YedE thiosulfate transporter family protein [unclassified Methanoculleus]